jgi:hypothetical protein
VSQNLKEPTMRQDAIAPGYTSAQTIAVLAGSSVMLTMSMGMRQSWGLFSVPITQDLGISVADFMLAIAIQNLVWGATQPIVGAYADKFGSRWSRSSAPCSTQPVSASRWPRPAR